MGSRGRKRLRVAVIGAGRVGSVLGRVMVEEGAAVTAVIARTLSSARAAGRFLRCRNVATTPGAIPEETDLLFIATPHDAVIEVAAQIASRASLPLRRMAACHASGMLGAAALAPLASRGATVFSFHPLQTFPRDFPVRRIVPSARGIWYGVDGSPGALRSARRLARLLRGHVLLVPPELRELYHAACVVASNHLTALLGALSAMHGVITGRNEPSLVPYGPIIAATVANVLATSPERALSGPVARGGVDTVRRHLEAVSARVPAQLPLFTGMTRETIRLAARKGALSAERRSALEDLCAQYAFVIRPGE